MKRKAVRLVLLLLLALTVAYVLNYSHGDETAMAAMASDEAVQITKEQYGWLFDGPGEEDLFVFYPGGKVEAQSYAPLLRSLAEKGVDCVLIRMPHRFAFLDIDRAEKAMTELPYDRCYLGGHSLGGAMAAVYAADHPEIAGLVLLAAYPTKDLPETMPVLSLYGSEDKVVSREKITQGQSFVSGEYQEHEIPGGNHAQYGSYGLQKGDGTAAISAQEQQNFSTSAILNFIRENSR